MRRRAVRNLHAGNDSRGLSSAGRKPDPTWMISAKDFREIFAAAPATSRFLKQSQKQLEAGPRHEIKSRRLSARRARQTCRRALSLLAAEPGAWLPIAGGTDVMVQYAAGKLPARKLVSIWNLPELRHIEILPDEIRIGAACTYTDVRAA